ncbi:MAG TPA: tRNA (N6-threonylcarbamoyladenosine(37)-N6)-methyltransferase TrmO, partial [Bacillota bacterium]|nr:tRNA (N6-threonylcarbamoyladenosine(37)-N6)-methyltransferase TrmO [Bacillota bacterium]
DILAVDETAGVITIPYIDAFDQSPILDLKPYIPVSERVKQVRVPLWFADWPEWYEDSGAFFSENSARLFGTE